MTINMICKRQQPIKCIYILILSVSCCKILISLTLFIQILIYYLLKVPLITNIYEKVVGLI